MHLEQCTSPSNPCCSECSGLIPAPTSAPTPSPSSSATVTDYRGEEMEADDYRLTTWLGDDNCDKSQAGNFNCEKFGYDCCDCMPWWQECEPDDYLICSSEQGKMSRRKLQNDDVESVGPTPRAIGTTTMKTTACASCSLGEYCPPSTTERTKQWCPTGYYCPSSSEIREVRVCEERKARGGSYQQRHGLLSSLLLRSSLSLPLSLRSLSLFRSSPTPFSRHKYLPLRDTLRSPVSCEFCVRRFLCFSVHRRHMVPPRSQEEARVSSRLLLQGAAVQGDLSHRKILPRG